MNTAKIRAIVFDVGGTLIRPARPIGETYADFAHRYGVRLTPEETTAGFLQAFKSSSPRGKKMVPHDGNDRVWWKQVVRRSLPEGTFTDAEAFENFFEAVYVYFAEPEAWELYPEVPGMLQALQHYPVDLAILSNWDDRLHPVLDGHGIGALLPRRFISAELGWEKPDPAIYRHVTDMMRLPGSSILSVGDHAQNDVEAPRQAGWQAIQIERPKCDLWSVMDALKR